MKRIDQLLKKARATARRFARDRRGNIAIFFALALIPVLGGAAGAIDFSRAYIVRERLSSALDAAGLAVGSMTALPQEEFQAKAQSYFDANYPDDALGTPGPVAVTEQDGQITLSATASMPTALLKIMGINDLNIGATVTIARESTGLELALVLDNTGSMAGSRIQALKDSSEELIGILFGEQDKPEKVKVAIVPFAAGVNVGTQYENEFWMDRQGKSSIHGENFEDPNGSAGEVNVWDLFDALQNKSWNGCVETRPQPLDENDTPPDIANPDTLFVPWFAPDEPDRKHWSDPHYPNNYLYDGDDVKNEGYPERQYHTGKYDNATVSWWDPGPHYGCDNLRPVTPLTNDKALLLNEIAALNASGVTHIPIGLAWGWRILSPELPFTEGTAYDDKDYKKAVILMTDGENVMNRQNTHNSSNYSAYGYAQKLRLGTASTTQAEMRMNEKLLRICQNVKDKEIRLYTITFQVRGRQTRELMRDCATSEAMYFDSPDSSTLRETFRQIATELNSLRIAK